MQDVPICNPFDPSTQDPGILEDALYSYMQAMNDFAGALQAIWNSLPSARAALAAVILDPKQFLTDMRAIVSRIGDIENQINRVRSDFDLALACITAYQGAQLAPLVNEFMHNFIDTLIEVGHVLSLVEWLERLLPTA